MNTLATTWSANDIRHYPIRQDVKKTERHREREVTDIDLVIAGNLMAARQQKGISLNALAGCVGIVSQQINKYEQGTNRIPSSRLYLLVRALDVPIETMFEGLD